MFEPYIHQTTLGIEFTGNPVTPAQSGSNPVSGTYRMVVNGSQGSSGSYVLEASIPWSNLGGTYTPSIGDQIGFGIGINDADQAGNTRDYQVMWSTNSDYLSVNSKYFPAVILVEDAPAATDCAEAVEMSPFLPSILSANFSDDDCIVNLRDFAVLADDWLGSWDIVDLADIAEQWLDCIDVTGNDASCVW